MGLNKEILKGLEDVIGLIRQLIKEEVRDALNEIIVKKGKLPLIKGDTIDEDDLISDAHSSVEPNTDDFADEMEQEKKTKKAKKEKAPPKKTKDESLDEVPPVSDVDDFEDLPDIEETKEPKIDQTELRHLLVTYAKKNGKTKAYEILGKYKAKKVDDLAVKDYEKIAKELKKNL